MCKAAKVFCSWLISELIVYKDCSYVMHTRWKEDNMSLYLHPISNLFSDLSRFKKPRFRLWPLQGFGLFSNEMCADYFSSNILSIFSNRPLIEPFFSAKSFLFRIQNTIYTTFTYKYPAPLSVLYIYNLRVTR